MEILILGSGGFCLGARVRRHDRRNRLHRGRRRKRRGDLSFIGRSQDIRRFLADKRPASNLDPKPFAF
jgi:hypothetical protein